MHAVTEKVYISRLVHVTTKLYLQNKLWATLCERAIVFLFYFENVFLLPFL